MAVGLPLKTTYANGDVYSASDVNDTNGTINAYVSTGKAAGVNKFLNSDFEIWQRGTSISLTTGANAYIADRFIASCSFSAGTSTVTRQTFTPGTAPVAGYEGEFFSRLTCGSTTTVWAYRQRIEDVRTFAGQTVTLSFWIKASAANATTAIQFAQVFGSGGSSTVTVDLTGPSITTSWQRFTVTTAIPSVSGKTIGTSSYLEVTAYSTTGIASSLAVDTWGWQLEAGSVATAFQTATGTIQGELAACQRYYWNATTANNTIGAGVVSSATNAFISVKYPQTMRITPTLTFATAATLEQAGSAAVTAASIAVAGTDGAGISCTSSSLTTGRGAILYVTTGSFQFSSEL
jgi:hypothetical protein